MYLIGMSLVICIGIPFLSILLVAVLVYCLVCKPRMKSIVNESDVSIARQRYATLERECIQSYTDMLGGLSLVRTSPSAKEWFTRRFDDILGERATTCVSCLRTDESSLLRTNLVGSAMYGLVAFAAVLGRHNLTAGYAGYLMANACYFSFCVTFVTIYFRVLCEVARKRDLLMHLIRSVPQEGPHVLAL